MYRRYTRLTVLLFYDWSQTRHFSRFFFFSCQRAEWKISSKNTYLDHNFRYKFPWLFLTDGTGRILVAQLEFKLKRPCYIINTRIRIQTCINLAIKISTCFNFNNHFTGTTINCYIETRRYFVCRRRRDIKVWFLEMNRPLSMYNW